MKRGPLLGSILPSLEIIYGKACMSSNEFFGKTGYVGDAWSGAKKLYEEASRIDLIAGSGKAAPRLAASARLVAETLDRLAGDDNFYHGLKAYIDDVQAAYQEVTRQIKDLDEFLKTEYGILTAAGYEPAHALELVQGVSITIGAVYALTHPDQIEELRKGLSRAGRALGTVSNSVERNIDKEAFLPRTLVKTARVLDAGFGILGGAVLVYEGSVSESVPQVVKLVSIGSGIVGIARKIEHIDKG